MGQPNEKVVKFMEEKLNPLFEKEKFSYEDMIQLAFPLYFAALEFLLHQSHIDEVRAYIFALQKTLDVFKQEFSEILKTPNVSEECGHDKD
jgi:hypothetical protein